MKLWEYVSAANTIGWFLGDYEISDQMIQDYALENHIIGLGYHRPDGAYVSWRLQDNP